MDIGAERAGRGETVSIKCFSFSRIGELVVVPWDNVFQRITMFLIFDPFSQTPVKSWLTNEVRKKPLIPSSGPFLSPLFSWQMVSGFPFPLFLIVFVVWEKEGAGR